MGVILQGTVHALKQKPVYGGTVPTIRTQGSEYQGAEAGVAPLNTVFINPLSAFCPPNSALQDW